MQTKKPFPNHREDGQIALLVLLVLTIAMTAGISVISRTITEIRVARDTELSSQAYAAAEAGIERALSTQLQVGDQGSLNLPDRNTSASYKITQLSNQGSDGRPFGFPTPVNKDEAVQVWLFNYADFTQGTLSEFFMQGRQNHTIKVYWGNPSKLNLNDDSTWPALEVTLIVADVSGNSLSNFNTEKYAFDPSTRKNQNNFIFNGISDPVNGFSITVSNLNQTKQLSFQHDIPLTISGSKQYLLMRAKLLYNNNSAHDIVIDPNGIALPTQGQVIDSEGRSENVVRKLRVYQSYPTLPGIFDFVLFNGSDNPLSK